MGQQYMMVESAMNCIDKAVDLCENLQGFFVIHSVGGGCGSGLGCAILQQLRDQFKKKCIYQPLIYPSQNMSNSVVEPYNCLLATHYMHRGYDHGGQETLSDLTMVMDNEQA